MPHINITHDDTQKIRIMKIHYPALHIDKFHHTFEKLENTTIYMRYSLMKIHTKTFLDTRAR